MLTFPLNKRSLQPRHWILLGILYLGIVLASFGQTSPTFIDWVKLNQTYLQIKVAKDGIYRIQVPLITQHFGNVSNLNAAGFQIFRRGKEQAIYVNSGNDNFLDGNDYIDFFGQMNDGSTEVEMYQKPMGARNEYRSVYDDTAHYFLTYSQALDGKRVVNNGLNNNSSVPFESFHWRRASNFKYEQYSLGKGLRGDITFSSYFTPGEGWCGRAYSVNFGDVVGSYNQFLYTPVNNISNLYLGGPQPILELLQYGRQSVNHKVDVIVSNNLVSLDTFRFTGRSSYLFRKSFNANLIENGTLHIWPAPRGTANVSVAYAQVVYPATFQMPQAFTSLSFDLHPNSTNYSRVRFDNLSASPELYDVTDPFNPIRIGVGFQNGSYIAGISNTAETRKMCIQSQVFSVGSGQAEKCRFTSFNPVNFDYIIVSHPNLRKPVGSVQDPVLAYKSYRESLEGGGHKVLVLEMSEVYQRFGYGDRNPLSLRNLCGFFVQNEVKVKALFLMGKGITVNNRFTGYYSPMNLIPTFGMPASDNAFAVGLGEPGRTISFPVGRLAAQTPTQVMTYLNKVKETEGFAYDDLWKKNVFQISGGLTSLEQSSFTNIMNNELRPKIQGPYMGASVGTFNKSSNQTIEYVDMRAVLNRGISLLNLFGHSSRTSPDVEIGQVSDPTQGFNNAGKYPLVIVNGCFTGNIYEADQSLNENWIFTPNKGAVMFWAASDEGLSANLRRHINTFYDVAFTDSALFGKPFGQIQKECMRKYLSVLSAEPQLDSSFMHQFMMHGDPVIRIFAAAKPDYKTDNSEVFLATANPNASSTSLRIGVIVSNFGRTIRDSLKIRVNRRYSDGITNDFVYQVKPVSYKDTFYFDLPQTQGFNYSGNNRFEVTLDFLNDVDEMNESNNVGFFEYFVPASGILPIFPKNYSIVGSRNVKLTVQSTDFFSPGRKYIFQIDTSARFNSGQGIFTQSPEILAGNLCSWNVLLPLDIDSTVFYWRVRFADQLSPADTTWYHMSFEYIKNSSNGWAQSHFYQFRKSEDQGVRKNYVSRTWEFPTQESFIDITVSGGSKQGPELYSLLLDGISVLKGAINSSDCYKPGYPRIGAVTLDRCSLKPKFWNYSNDPIGYYYTGCGRLPFSVNIFEMTKSYNTLRVYFQKYINARVNEGDYVILFPLDSVVMDSLRKYGNDVLPLIGVDVQALAGLQNGNPFIILGKRTANPSPGQATVVLPLANGSPTNRQTLNLKKQVQSACSAGLITSTKIGPASQWKKLIRRFADGETAVSDRNNLELIGIRLNGKDSVLQKQIPSFPFDLTSINADTFPYLQLRASVNDSTFFTPSTLKRWMVLYEGVPEGVINTTLVPIKEYQPGLLQEGDSLGFRFAFTNISNKEFADSVKVHFYFNGQIAQEKLLGKLKPDSSLLFSYPRFSTLGKSGNNQLLAFVNPRIQPEEYYENNALNIPFRVAADKFQPVLDVTFDGVKIMNGDFVSNTPLVSVSLKDENKFLLKTDTVGMVLLLNRPCTGCQTERIPFNSPNIKVYPAGADNLFRLEYRPDKLENGLYRLAVQGADVKGNPSGSNVYQVEFNVLDQNTITNFYPYPNPFTTSCQWVFTLTGEMPDDFKIQIMTVTGKVVREIMKSELGPLRIGNNITTYRWNGTDEFGDRLANGVYLYRVVMKEGVTFAKRETAGDHTFTKGFGKLYIIR